MARHSGSTLGRGSSSGSMSARTLQTSRTSTPIEVLAGLVERVTFHNDENGFCVLQVKTRGQRDLITVLGHAAMISAGEFVQASGTWVNDRTHGVKFKASFLRATAPTTVEGIEKYLGSGMIRGIGFHTADQIAAKLGIEKTALIRVRAGISYALAEAMDDGHCGLPAEDLVSLTEKLLEVPTRLVETALGLELDDGAVVGDDLEGRRCVFLAGLYRAEREIAEKLGTLAVGKPPWPSIDVDKAIPWVEQRTQLALADSQRAALRAALVSKVMVITGGPGVGKTKLVNSLLKILLAKSVTIALCAPTGRAAKRLSESTGLEAKTIHRLLETDPRTGHFRRDENEPLDCDLLVVDETSMVDVPLMRAVLRALPEGTALLLVGDVDQLPSVGPGKYWPTSSSRVPCRLYG
jgi:ATP-dependent exoDNAse (exonuclease V) alpha subunit